jgi:hypothetical protein
VADENEEMRGREGSLNIKAEAKRMNIRNTKYEKEVVEGINRSSLLM